MGFAPFAHGLHEGRQSLAVFSQAVLGLGRHDGIDLPVDDAGRFQFAQLLGQHLRRRLRDEAAQFGKAQDTLLGQIIEDDTFYLPPMRLNVASTGQWNIFTFSLFINKTPGTIF